MEFYLLSSSSSSAQGANRPIIFVQSIKTIKATMTPSITTSSATAMYASAELSMRSESPPRTDGPRWCESIIVTYEIAFSNVCKRVKHTTNGFFAIISAVFAACAKLFIFYIGYSGRRIMRKSTVKRMRPLERIVKKYGAVAAFVAAATPIPDDLIYIPLGLARYNPLRFFLYTLAGKFVISYVTIILSHHLGPSVLGGLSERIDNSADAYIAVALLVVILGVIVALMVFIDWTKIIGRFAPWALEEDEESK